MASSDTAALTGFVNHFKVGMGATAVTTFIGIIIAFIVFLIISIIHATGKSNRIIMIIGCVVALIMLLIAFLQPVTFALSLMGYALVIIAVFIGFIYNDGRDSVMRLISVAIFAAVCIIKYRFY
jgi:hypothetical protein